MWGVREGASVVTAAHGQGALLAAVNATFRTHLPVTASLSPVPCPQPAFAEVHVYRKACPALPRRSPESRGRTREAVGLGPRSGGH